MDSIFMNTFYPVMDHDRQKITDSDLDISGKKQIHDSKVHEIVQRKTHENLGMVTQIVYDHIGGNSEEPKQGNEFLHYKQSVERIKVFSRSWSTVKSMAERKKWKHFGASKGTVGLERGVSMVADRVVYIDDPFSDEANLTDDDRIVAQLLASVKNKNTNSVDPLVATVEDTGKKIQRTAPPKTSSRVPSAWNRQR